MNRKIMEVVNSEDNGLRSFIGYICYNTSYIGYKGLQRLMEELRNK